MFFSHRRRTLAGGGPIGHQISIIALDPTIAVLSRLSLLLLLLLASCGDLPEPFIGNPGATGRLLAQPPTPRLAVPPPTDALLPDAASRQFADSLAGGLQAQEVPAVADRVRSNDWQLVATAEQRGGNVVPLFRVLNPKGEDKGNTEGSPVPTQVWAAAARDTLDQTALEAAPKISSLLTGIQHADPNSLYNRIAKVEVATVTGAPGDGNVSLTKQMKAHLVGAWTGGAGRRQRRRLHRAGQCAHGADRRQPAAGGDPVDRQDARAATNAARWCSSTKFPAGRSTITGPMSPSWWRPRRPAA